MQQTPGSAIKQQTRKKYRQLRNALSEQEQKQAATSLMSLITTLPAFMHSHSIAFYIASDGEIDPAPLLEQALLYDKSCYLPCVDSMDNPVEENHLAFVRYKSGDRLTANKYGIPEPLLSSEAMLPAEKLDLVLMPLVAFDVKGNRLGMGKGYFDRTFAFINPTRPESGPMLMGLAHECQKAAALSISDWDIPLHYIATDKQIYTFSHHTDSN